ncbi:uncharacterized protein B0T15DRAFT_526981 [Chaetomium strumarium]|uniref:Uncharacterized protein n=1 Tax=Chaetomium strumarium TaxID=1170767 RepID=A0AAJ0M2H8_9PEZI|nr:hypothetical protein B0T15DRAFT_526981 [Chaetomium strumarium]
MTDRESPTIPQRLDPGVGVVGDKASRSLPYSASYPGVGLHQTNMDDAAAASRGPVFDRQSFAVDDAMRLPQPPNPHHIALSRSTSQGTTNSTNGADPVFTPPANGGRVSPGSGSAGGSSQDSQLRQLSQIAAAQERIPEDTAEAGTGASRKRMADGMVKHTRDMSNVSPGQMAGHSRNTSTVSVASTAGSRIGELSAELKTRLSYAMVKVTHGWQSHSIDQVETLASQAASPASTASTIHMRNGSSASPQLSAASHPASNNATPATAPYSQNAGRPGDLRWRESPQSTSRGSSASPVKTNPGLAPPVSIQPSQHPGNPRRDPNARHVPSFLSTHHTSPRSALHTSPYLAPGRHQGAMAEAMLVSPHTNVREQDAIESLLFMSSPGNSANLKHAFPSSSQPLPSSHHATGPQRTALPTSQPRKSLPSGRPSHHSRSQSQSQPTTTVTKRVNFEKSPSAMDIDEPQQQKQPFGSPMSVTRGTPQQRRRMNGSSSNNGGDHLLPPPPPPPPPPAGVKQLPVSAGLSVPSRPRPALADEEIDAMLERAAAAAEDSDSDGEIQIPVNIARGRRDGASATGAAGTVVS